MLRSISSILIYLLELALGRLKGMADSSSIAADIGAIASSAVPVLGTATAALKLADDGLGLISEPIKSAQIDKPINEANDRISKYESILSENSPNQLSADLGDFIGQLFVDANTPTGELSGRTRRIPVEHLNGFILIGIAYIEQREKQSVAGASGK